MPRDSAGTCRSLGVDFAGGFAAVSRERGAFMLSVYNYEKPATIALPGRCILYLYNA